MSAIRVCAISDIQCSHGCGSGPCRKEQTPNRLAEEVTMPKKYEQLDALILASIDKTPKLFSAINVGEVAKECEQIARSEGKSRSPFGVSPFRICDRRLQALRKAGKIVSTTKGWTLP